MPKLTYVGPSADVLVDGVGTFDRDGDPVEVEDTDVAKSLKASGDFVDSRSSKTSKDVIEEQQADA